MQIIEKENHEQQNNLIEIASTRQAQEVQAAMVIAQKFPRKYAQAKARIMEACKRKALAESAEYQYPRGGAQVRGASIRLAETLAQCWGNIDTGLIELDNSNGQSTMMAYAWDLETNTRSTKIFTIEHKRHTRKGVTNLTDSRDIYELTANFGSRRQRACILAIIPGDVVDAAIDECRKTLTGSYTEPLIDRLTKMVASFKEEFQVNQSMIEERFGCNLEDFSEAYYLDMRGIYKALRDGQAKREDYFDVPKKITKPNSSLDKDETRKPANKNSVNSEAQQENKLL